MTSIHEVAALANVSITTVSHVFSGRRYVSADTIARVQQAAEQLNYAPRATARGLATGRSMILGVAFPAPVSSGSLQHNPYFSELLECLSAAAAHSSCAILLVPRSSGTVSKNERIGLLRRLDGVVMADPSGLDIDLAIYLDLGMKVVTIGRSLTATHVPWVDGLIADGVRQIIEHAVTNNYTKLALFTARQSDSYHYDIETMFVQEAAARGLQARVYYDDCVAGVTPFESAKVILSSDHRPDFIFAGTDFGAAAVLRAATDIGMNVPNDLGIVGAGNTILAFASVPPLSSLNLFQRSLAEAAVGKLLDDIEGRDFEQESRLPVELIVRASSQRHLSATRHG